jgi:L-serine dehydratase
VKYQSAFEIIGPIMVGPSSSHTAGAVRIGNIANQLLNEEPVNVTFSLMGSFAETYEGHGTDLALLAGVLGLTTSDDNIPYAKQLAEEHGLNYKFARKKLGSYHPNTVLIELAGETKEIKILASSVGGGKVEVQELDDYPLKFSAEIPTLVINHRDQQGFIANLSYILNKNGYNIARLALERFKKNGPAITVCEIDNKVEEDLLPLLKKEIPIIEEIRKIQTK